ncbi:MAG: ABC transporter ATP-binding protein [Fusobacteriaceae bacterium]
MKNGFNLNNISKSFEMDSKTVNVFNNLSLNIPNDKITVILGKSGCGKTTLLKILSSLDKINQGEITYHVENITKSPKCSLIFQESRLMPWLTVEENISFSRKTSVKDISHYLHMMKLEKFKDLYPHQLSGGMAHRVAIARALCFDPEILLMDEPFSSLDYFTREQLQNEIIKIYLKYKKGIVFVTHNIDESLLLGSKVVVFDSHKNIKEFYIEEGYPRDLLSDNLISLKKDILNILKD